jgi:molecular chaperone IbpA
MNIDSTWFSAATNVFNDPFFVGWNPTITRIDNAAKTNTGTFPPYNVRKIDEDAFVIELAIAGYNNESVSVTEHNGTLIVEGDKPEDTEEYLHKGISSRKFRRTFSLGEYIVVKSANVSNGILYIDVNREIPEEKKPKTIKVT